MSPSLGRNPPPWSGAHWPLRWPKRINPYPCWPWVGVAETDSFFNPKYWAPSSPHGGILTWPRDLLGSMTTVTDLRQEVVSVTPGQEVKMEHGSLCALSSLPSPWRMFQVAVVSRARARGTQW